MPFIVISGDGEARRQGAWDDVKLPLMVNCSAPAQSNARPMNCFQSERDLVIPNWDAHRTCRPYTR